MKKILISAAVAAALASSALGAQQTMSGCGLGYMLFGKENPNNMPMQLAATLFNGTSGNQTFGISSGTSGCNPDGVWASNEELNNFTGQNIEKLAADMARGNGETLDAFADLAGVADKPAFFAATQQNFERIYTHENITAGEVLTNLQTI